MAVGFQPDVGVEVVGGDESRVVAAAAGGHGGDGRAARQHVRPVHVQQREDGVDGRRGRGRRRFPFLGDCSAEQEEDDRDQQANHNDRLDNSARAGQTSAAVSRKACHKCRILIASDEIRVTSDELRYEIRDTRYEIRDTKSA
ncbi:MAG: hypothetical protein DCC51_14530 [Anaerolineae bacterium]|nr:MAG: hypothetical protein DCC51_14530 [Anaerolineae bacterium]